MENSTSSPDFQKEFEKVLEQIRIGNDISRKNLEVSESAEKKVDNLIDRTEEVQLDASTNFDILKNQNQDLSMRIESIIIQNIELKKIVKKNSSDKVIRAVAFSFLSFFSISILFTFFLDYQLVKFNWAKVGILVSFAIYLIGYFVHRMVQKL